MKRKLDCVTLSGMAPGSFPWCGVIVNLGGKEGRKGMVSRLTSCLVRLFFRVCVYTAVSREGCPCFCERLMSSLDLSRPRERGILFFFPSNRGAGLGEELAAT